MKWIAAVLLAPLVWALSFIAQRPEDSIERRWLAQDNAEREPEQRVPYELVVVLIGALALLSVEQQHFAVLAAFVSVVVVMARARYWTAGALAGALVTLAFAMGLAAFLLAPAEAMLLAVAPLAIPHRPGVWQRMRERITAAEREASEARADLIGVRRELIRSIDRLAEAQRERTQALAERDALRFDLDARSTAGWRGALSGALAMLAIGLVVMLVPSFAEARSRDPVNVVRLTAGTIVSGVALPRGAYAVIVQGTVRHVVIHQQRAEILARREALEAQ